MKRNSYGTILQKTEVTEDTKFQIVISLGKELVEVPDVIGNTRGNH